MTVYVITRGDYSDYHICAVSLNKDKAKKLAKMYSTSYDPASVEEWETDTVTDIHVLNGKCPYTVTFYPDKEPWVWRISYDYRYFAEGIQENNKSWLAVNVYAKDEAAALKIASDKRAQYLAEKEGIV